MVAVVDEHHAMTDEDVVLDGDALAHKSVAGNFAALADTGIFLDLDKSANLGFVADLASVEIDELGQLHIPPQLHVRRDAYMRIDGQCIALRLHCRIYLFTNSLLIAARAVAAATGCGGRMAEAAGFRAAREYHLRCLRLLLTQSRTNSGSSQGTS